MRVHHQVDGCDGSPTVVMHTSLGCSLRMWDPQVRPLVAAGARVVRYDFSGHGKSLGVAGPRAMEDFGGDVVDMMDTLGIADAIHVGLSLGGMIAMWLAEHASARVTGLVLCATSAALTPTEPWLERAAAVRTAGSTEAIPDTFLPRWLSPEFSACHPDVVEWVRAQILETSADGFAGGCDAIAGMDLLHSLGSIDVPTSVLVGSHDLGTPPEHAEHIAAAIPGATVTILDPGAHLISVERPEPVTAAIVNMVGRLRSRRAG